MDKENKRGIIKGVMQHIGTDYHNDE